MDVDARDLPPLLWHTLKQKLKPSEELEVKRIIGWAEVENNEELHQEALQLVDILHECGARLILCFFVTSCACTESASTPRSSAASNSACSSRAILNGSFCKLRLPPATDTSASHSFHKTMPVQVSRLDIRRPSSSSGRPSTASSSSCRSRADTSRSSHAAAAGDDSHAAAAGDHEHVLESAACLNIETVEGCVGSLQLRLRREADNLIQNIAILHLALEDERDRENENAASSLPSLEQLRATSSQLQAEFNSRSQQDGGDHSAYDTIPRGRLRPHRVSACFDSD
jgi:hypothetical protein